MDVDAVQQRAANLAEILLDLSERAAAFPGGVSPKTAAAPVRITTAWLAWPQMGYVPPARRLPCLVATGRPVRKLIERGSNFLFKGPERGEAAQCAVVSDEFSHTTHPLSDGEVAEPASAQPRGIAEGLVKRSLRVRLFFETA